MGTLLSPGQPGFRCLRVDTDLHVSWGSLPASTAPKDYLKPTLFRNKSTVCTTHGPMEPAWCGHGKSPWGKSTKAITKRVGGGAVLAKGIWGLATAAAGAPGAIASGTGARRDGENATNVAASRNAPSYGGWCNLM